MTTNNMTQRSALPDAPFDDDPRASFAKAVALGGAVIDAVLPDQLENPTPCTDFDVRALLGHLLDIPRYVAGLGRGEEAYNSAQYATETSDDAWGQAWRDACHEVQSAWSDDAVLSRTMHVPWGEFTGGAILAGFTNEITVHTWDLATATGQRPQWDPHVLEVAFESIRQILPAEGRAARFEAFRQSLPEEQRNFADPFADAVPIAAEAPLIDRLVAWNGRRP